MTKLLKHASLFLASLILFLAIGDFDWFNNIVEKQWFINMSTSFSTIGIGLIEIVAALIGVYYALTTYLSENLPYPILCMRKAYRQRYATSLQGYNNFEIFWISWYLYSIEERLVKLRLANSTMSILDRDFFIEGTTIQFDFQTIKNTFYDSIYLLRFVSVRNYDDIKLHICIKNSLNYIINNQLGDYCTYLDIFYLTFSILGNLNINFRSINLKKLWKYCIISNTTLHLHFNTTLFVYSLDGLIPVLDIEYDKCIYEIRSFLNEIQNNYFSSIINNIQYSENNLHKLQIIEL